MEQFSFKSSYMKSVTLFKSTIVVYTTRIIDYCEFNTLHKYIYDGCIIIYVILYLKTQM